MANFDAFTVLAGTELFPIFGIRQTPDRDGFFLTPGTLAPTFVERPGRDTHYAPVAELSTLVPISRTRYYKFRAPCTSSPTGYIEWVNTTGDNTNAPPCVGTQGATSLVRTWKA